MKRWDLLIISNPTTLFFLPSSGGARVTQQESYQGNNRTNSMRYNACGKTVYYTLRVNHPRNAWNDYHWMCG